MQRFSEPVNMVFPRQDEPSSQEKPVEQTSEAGSASPLLCVSNSIKVDALAQSCANGPAPRIIRRFTQDGKPGSGDPSKFEHSFAIKDPSGLQYDFREGPRLFVPPDMLGDYDVEFQDYETGFVHFRTVLRAGESVASPKRWYIPWRILVKKDGKTVFDHCLDLNNREVCIHIPNGGLGDSIAWFSYAEPFMLKHNCKLTVCMDPDRSRLFRGQYPAFGWGQEHAWKTTPYYAVYHMGIFSPDNENCSQPEDFRMKGLHHNAAAILGLPEKDNPPRVGVSWNPVKGDGRYVCIASRASARCKEWLNPAGWPSLVSWLKDKGYKVIDIDKEFLRGYDVIPYGADNCTGSADLLERAKMIAGASFFIGVSSGLSWLAWCCGTPVVLISGWTLPYTEFSTPYRVINRQVCHGCWNDMREQFDHYDGDYCPRHKGTPREHECSMAISAEQVMNVINRMPDFGK